LPHQGSFQEAGVIEQSYQLNVPVGSEKLEMDHSTYSLMEIEDPGVIVEGVKRAEDYEDRYLFRIYEAYGRRTKTAIKPGFSFGKAFSVNLIEDIKEELEPTGDKLELEFDPFEIKSVLIEQK
jgi:alpha-mannosidase